MSCSGVVCVGIGTMIVDTVELLCFEVLREKWYLNWLDVSFCL